ncbi:MAG: N-acetylmuramoyl-L-alanine amidase, partial [Paramuribaculum sp.]|nr:N-acetylmuramoyl-L-alanine amidase [Paramuribaculum sp.]
RTTVCGASVYTMSLSRSDENLAVAMRENSVLTLEPDYSTEYHGFDPNSAESYIIFQMDQNLHMEQSLKVANYIQQHLVSEAGRKDRGVRQAPFSVLRNTAMPAVLVELDFICNPTVEKYLASAEGRQQLAEAMYSGGEQYREETDRNIRLRNNEPLPPVVKKEPATDAEPAERLDVENQKAEPQPQEVNTNEEGVKYKVQFYVSSTLLKNNDRRLKNLRDIGSYKHQGMVKYTSGSFDTLEEAMKYLPEVKKYYPDAFVVKMENNRRID